MAQLVNAAWPADITAVLGKEGRLRHPVVAVGREKSGAGRVFAYPVRKLTAAKTPDGCEVSLISTDDADHELQVSSDLTNWKTLATLKAAAQPGRFMDKAAVGADLRFYRTQQTNGVL